MPETQWMTLSETAGLMKRLPDQVTQMCEDGKLEYYMEDGRYFVSRESIDLFMHPPISQAAPANPDSNGTPRRQYGRAPHELEPSPESALDTQAVNGLDEVDAGGGSAPEVDMEKVPGRGMEEAPGRGDDVAETAVGAQSAEATEAAENPGEPDVRAVEILADLRAALSRHAREHKAFCDEIAALADALESTLSHDGDKTSELTREISSLLARYTRR